MRERGVIMVEEMEVAGERGGGEKDERMRGGGVKGKKKKEGEGEMDGDGMR
jgi:hypothetical protein